MTFKNNAPFINCISKINVVKVDNAEDLDVDNREDLEDLDAYV